MIFTQVKKVFMSCFAERAEHEALLSYDFKLIDFKTALMRLCFSPLANFPIFIAAVILYYNPFRYQLQLLAGAPGLLSLLYSPQWATGIALGMICSYFIGVVGIPIFLILYFVSQGEIHTILGASLIVGVFLGRGLRYLRLAIRLEGKTRSTALYFGLIQIFSLAAAVGVDLWIYQWMQVMGYFSRTLFAYRFEFIVISLFMIYLNQFIFNSIWGHFYSRSQNDPADLNTFYSTARLLKRWSISSNLREQLQSQSEAKYQDLQKQLNDPSVSYLPQSILQKARIEKDDLERALRFWSSPVPK